MKMNNLKIAIQKSGRLHDDSMKLLKECGIDIDNGRDQLKVSAKNFPIELLFLRNSDIPEYLADGVADCAILGQNVVLESQIELIEKLPLGFAKCRLSIASPKNEAWNGITSLNGKKIATSYPNTVKQYLSEKGVSAELHTISGSVEIAPNIGLADSIADLVSSGSTLLKNGLEEREEILRSEAALFANSSLDEEQTNILNQLLFRIKSVLLAKNNKYVLLNAPNESIKAINEILPGVKSPTVMPLMQSGWSSVHSVINENDFWDVIGQLKQAGAEGILVIPIEKMIA
jgi:ATP phosphoribosyltransferase